MLNVNYLSLNNIVMEPIQPIHTEQIPEGNFLLDMMKDSTTYYAFLSGHHLSCLIDICLTCGFELSNYGIKGSSRVLVRKTRTNKLEIYAVSDAVFGL